MKERKVVFDRELLVIRVGWYEIDLERANDSAELLDWIVQLTRKSWCTPQVLHDFFTALETACQEVFGETTQGVFCPWGRGRRVNWRSRANLLAQIERLIAESAHAV